MEAHHTVQVKLLEQKKNRIHPTRSVATRTPDLNSVDYKIWELMQECVYKTSIQDTSDLKQRLTDT